MVLPTLPADVIDEGSRWWLPWSLLAGVALGLAGAGLSVALVRAFTALLSALAVELSPPTLLTLTLLLGQYVAFGGVAYSYLRLRGRSLGSVGARAPSPRELAAAVGGWLAALGLVTAAGMAIQAAGAETASNQTARLGADFPTLLLVLIPASFLVVGPCEELLFRGIVQRRFREAFSPAVAVVLAAALFALIHFTALGGPTGARLTTVSVLFFPSLVFGAVYEYTDNVVASALVHGAYDATLFALLYVVVQFAGL